MSFLGFAYFAVISMLSIAQPASGRLSFIILVALFVPFGAILLAGFGSHRWLLALVAGALGVLWLELACIVWNSTYPDESENLTARILGVVLGIAIYRSLAAVFGKRARLHATAFTRLSQARHPQLSPERRHD